MADLRLKSNVELMRSEPDQKRFADAFDLSKEDRLAAILEYEKLADMGSVLAKLYLGYVNKGLGRREEAASWFKKAYEAGSVEGTLYQGIMKAEDGVWNEAEIHFRRGAESGDAPSMNRLAKSIIAQGQKKSRLREVVSLLKSARANGHIRAENNLAFLYMEGSCGVKRIPVGLFLYFSSICKAVVEASRDPKSYRLW